MGRLMHLDEIPQYEKLWFFKTGNIDSRYETEFKSVLYIDQNRISGYSEMDPKLTFVDIRKFVDQMLGDTVIVRFQNLNYFYRYSSASDGYQVQHGYYCFHFESDVSCTLFKLNFSEHITTERLRWREHTIPYDRKDRPNVFSERDTERD